MPASLGSADVVVAGAGPAGLAAAAALGERGLSVLCLAPSHGASWWQTYASWEGDLPAGTPLARRFPAVDVAWGEAAHGDVARRAGGAGGPVAGTGVERPYGVVDAPALQATLTARCDAAGVRRERGTAVDVAHPGPLASVVRTGDGREVVCRLVVDATGAAAALVRRGRGVTATAHQTAYGLVGAVEGAPSALLMDWSDAHLPPDERDGVPSFLYALDLGDGRTLLEETVLAARPAPPPRALEGRLARRLDALGLRVPADAAVEQVRIPLDLSVPAPQAVVAVGVAGGAVHPATGYAVGASLRSAPVLADAVATALDTGADPARAAWSALWPRAARATRALHAFGLEALLGMSSAQTQAFFAAFFALDADDVVRYLSGQEGPAHTAAVMSRLFSGAPPEVRRGLVRAAVGPGGRATVPALAAGLWQARRP